MTACRTFAVRNDNSTLRFNLIAGNQFICPKAGLISGASSSAFAIALHMHQPLIPAGGSDLATAEIISNLKHMMDNPGIGDNHNAPVFHWCYKRMGEFIPQLVDEGKQPRVMLEYSGTLLHGLRHDGAATTCSTT